MDLFDIAVAKKLSGGGGGGSSDFTTAKLTLIDSEEWGLNVPFVAEFPMLGEYIGIVAFASGVYDVVLYKNLAIASATDYEHPVVSVSGDAEIMGDMVFITGDCTITIS